MGEPGVGLLVELGDPDEAAHKLRTPPNIEEQMRRMDLSMQKRRDSAKAKKCQRESPPNFDDIVMLQDEEFDFEAPGLSTSSDSLAEPDEDDEEVFFGKVGLTEKCVAKIVEQEEVQTKVTESAPLSAAEMAEIFVEAQKVACFISIQDRDKSVSAGVTTPSVSTRLFARVEGQSSVETRSQGRKRKGTFTLEDEEPAKRPGHSRKGTFTLDSSDEDTPAKEPKSTLNKTLEIPPKDSAVPVKGSKLQRNAPQRRSLKMPSGRFGLAKGADQPSKTIGPLKALPKPAIETKERTKRLSGSIPQPAAAVSQLPQQSARGHAVSGLKAPGSSLQQPVAGRGGISGLKAPMGSLLQRPGSGPGVSGLKAPTRRSLPAPTATTTSLTTAKPSLKAPTTKLQLMRPGQIQMRGPVVKQPAGQNGPMKATERLSGLKGPETRVPLTSHVNGVTQPQPAVKRAGSPIRRSMQTTPVKLEKNVQPKRLMAGLQCLGTPPRKSSDSSNTSQTPTSTKRRSFLPTPGRTFTGPRRNSSSVSSVSSMESNASPQLRGRSPSTRRSIASPMRARPKVQHTPQNKENTGQETKRSIWSPIKRRKPLTKEEELTQCTKRTTYSYQ